MLFLFLSGSEPKLLPFVIKDIALVPLTWGGLPGFKYKVPPPIKDVVDAGF
jgi:hypothetical protein